MNRAEIVHSPRIAELYFPRLLNATKEQREKYEISGGGTGLHWDEINEDISVKTLLMGVGDRTLQSSKSATEKP